jgi:triosephosphate isomerase
LEVIVLPTSLDIRNCLEKFLIAGAQYGRPEPKGAFTGDVSMQILAEHGCRYVLCGHSERRRFHGEIDAFVAQQAEAAVAVGLLPIVCVGETAEERNRGEAEAVVTRQVKAITVPAIFAYEPVWAIGTGMSASPQDAQSMHACIRSLLSDDFRSTTRILYGGSVNAENAAAILAQPDIDGALVGGASLDPKAFAMIVQAALNAFPHIR